MTWQDNNMAHVASRIKGFFMTALLAEAGAKATEAAVTNRVFIAADTM